MVNEQSVKNIILELQAKKEVPRKSIMLAIGWMKYVVDKHLNNLKYVEANAAKDIIKYLRSKV